MHITDGRLYDVLAGKDTETLRNNPNKFWKGVKEIGYKCFKGCIDQIDLEIPDSVEKINRQAFAESACLRKVVLPSSIKRIPSEAFSCCLNLKEVVLAEGLEEIGTSAFYLCPELKEIKIPNSVSVIGAGAFSSCNNLSKVTFGESLKDIEYRAFVETDLKEIVLPEGLEKIGEEAFAGNKNVESITIPSSVREFGNSLFSADQYGVVGFHNCKKLKTITFKDKSVIDESFMRVLKGYNFNEVHINGDEAIFTRNIENKVDEEKE